MWGLTIETDNFAFEVKVILGQESNLLKSWDTRPDRRTAGQKKPGIEAVASLKRLDKKNVPMTSCHSFAIF